jgi:hypothetical protein
MDVSMIPYRRAYGSKAAREYLAMLAELDPEHLTPEEQLEIAQKAYRDWGYVLCGDTPTAILRG